MEDIGKIIEKELRDQERSVSWLAKKLCRERTVIYDIFSRKSVDTDLLMAISEALGRDFFALYSDELRRKQN